VPQPFGPAEHQATKRALGLRSVAPLIATKKQDRDPFYCGSDTERRHAEWFAGIWRQFSERFGGRVHLRRIHYLASQTPGTLARDGTPYRNIERHWGWLSEASRWARYLGLVDPERFTDRRTEGVQRNVPPRRDVQPEWEITRSGGVWVPGLPQPPDLFGGADYVHVTPPEGEATGYLISDADQPVLVELWVEKSTVNDIVVPLCYDLGVNLKVGKGNESITEAIALLRRAEQARRPVHVLYVCDLDTKGESMPVSVARQCQFWRQKLHIDQRVTVERLVLNTEQVDYYGLPQAPDSGDTELDALEALHPGELERIITKAAAPWRDPELAGRGQDAQEEADAAVQAGLRRIADDAARQLAELSERSEAIHERVREQLRPMAAQWRQVVQAAEPELGAVRAAAAAVEAAMHEAVNNAELVLPERPDAEEPDVDRSGLLYDSQRDWLDQVGYYHRARRDGQQ
jgi:hypothetical protein